eukprot:TRINITY_DN22095_c0_g1_i1.p1 TRINITY_DN22095_c0_g1~~TRINITY_DN22095_c0_g1_i1.p1  ORF type:complete len:693 (-),score=84.51 TRINITY_DN22095_c0_g1_i1:99-2177(-)
MSGSRRTMACLDGPQMRPIIEMPVPLRRRSQGNRRTWLALGALATRIGSSDAAAAPMVASNASSSTSSMHCLVGSRREKRGQMFGVEDESQCCAMASLYLARRNTGYCPHLPQAPRLPFTARCMVDPTLNHAYVPDFATARAAERALCEIPGCPEAVGRLLDRTPTLGTRPSCSELQRASVEGTSLTVRLGLAALLATVTTAVVVVFHMLVAPIFVRFAAKASKASQASYPYADGITQSNAGVRDVVLGLPVEGGSQLAILDIGGEVDDPPSPPPKPPETPSAPRVPPTPLSPDCVPVVGRELVVFSPSAVNLPGQEDCTATALERAAAFDLSTTRACCRAHISLMCALGLAATLARVALTAALLSPSTWVLALLVFLGSLWQLGSLARARYHSNFKATPLEAMEAEAERCSLVSFLGDLRVFAYTCTFCELVSLAVGVSNLAPHQDADGSSLGTDSLKYYLLDQVAVNLVIVRLYTAWLALSLHKLHEELTLAVLPVSLQATLATQKPLSPTAKADLSMRLDESALALAWTPDLDDSDPQLQAARARGRKRARQRVCYFAVGALSLGLAAACAGVLRSLVAAHSPTASTCQTASPGMDFCVEKEYIGLFQAVASPAECCALCDGTDGCDAWTFKAPSGSGASGGGGMGRCWRLRFVSSPCKEHPSHFSCRCRTHSVQTGGYRPSSGSYISA